MLIDTSYFFGNLSIPQVTNSAVDAELSSYIESLETDFLQHLLGYGLWKAYDAGTAPVTRWTDLESGKEYTNKFGYLAKWKGLLFEVGDTKKSPIANYVYFHFMKDHVTTSTPGGEKGLKTQNADPASSRLKLARAWNEMIGWNRELVDFMEMNLTTYPEFNISEDRTELITTINPLF
jgi:hypothetical protein